MFEVHAIYQHKPHLTPPPPSRVVAKQPEEPRPVSNVEKGLALLHSVRFVSQTRQRTLFVPFLLRNSTGLSLRFSTLTSVPSKVTDLYTLRVHVLFNTGYYTYVYNYRVSVLVD